MDQHGFRDFHYASDDGLSLHGRIYGTLDKNRPPILCLPGLSRNSRDFHQLALLLAAEGNGVVALDYRGRGLSAWDANTANYNIVREAQDVLAALKTLDLPRAIFIGTSRGGLILHILAAMAPDVIAALVLNDIGPVLEIEGLKQIRDYLGARPQPASMAQAARALKATHGSDFSALTDRDWDEMAEAIFREIDGRIQPDYDPALVEPLKTMDLSQPLPDMWAQFAGFAGKPMLIIRGENSKLLSETVMREMQARHAGCQTMLALGQGHAPILHKADVWSTIREFLRNI